MARRTDDRSPSRERPSKRTDQRRNRSRSTSSDRNPTRHTDDTNELSTRFATVSSKRSAAVDETTKQPESASDSNSDSDTGATLANREHNDDDDDEERKAALKLAASRNYGLITASGEKIALKRSADDASAAAAAKPAADRRKTAAVKPVAKSRQPLSDAERAQRLAEMQANAEWRDSDRRRAVGEYRAAERAEQSVQQEQFDHDFANKAMQKAMASQLSVESRLRANKNNIQRSATAMDENFARR